MVGWVGGKCEDGLLGHCPLIDYPRSNGRAARLSGQIHKRYFTPGMIRGGLTRVSKLGVRDPPAPLKAKPRPDRQNKH